MLHDILAWDSFLVGLVVVVGSNNILKENILGSLM